MKIVFFLKFASIYLDLLFILFKTRYLPRFNAYIPMNTLVCINFLLGKNFIVIGTRYCFVFKACKLMKKEIIIFDEKISHNGENTYVLMNIHHRILHLSVRVTFVLSGDTRGTQYKY